METRETFSRTEGEDRMLQNTEYYKYIFKKTEKIACAVFYILRLDRSVSQNDSIVSDLEKSAQVLIDVSLESLKSTQITVSESARELSFALMRLESKLRIGSAAKLVNPDLLTVFLHEIDSVQRSLRKYVDSGRGNPIFQGDSGRTDLLGTKRLSPRARIERMGTVMNDDGGVPVARRERVITVIRDKGEASIKDIVEVVTDCSEKTIQRELNALIKDNIVHREGERRWSKYRLV
jgi:hypothetical protein